MVLCILSIAFGIVCVTNAFGIMEKATIVVGIILIVISVLGFVDDILERNIMKFATCATLGILSICSGIFKWKFPSIYWFLRDTRYGEIINSIVWIVIGVILIIVSLL